MRNSNIFNHENAFQNIVCEMAAILSRAQYVNVNTFGSNAGLFQEN